MLRACRRFSCRSRVPCSSIASWSLQNNIKAAERGDCRFSISRVAAMAGVAETTVRRALRAARDLCFVTVKERRMSAWRNLPNVVRIVSAERTAWLRLGRR